VGGPRAALRAPGHYYSPIASIADLRANSTRLFAPFPRELPGIDLNEAGQLALLSLLEGYYRDLPFGADPIGPLRYVLDNPGYAWSDQGKAFNEAYVLRAFLRFNRAFEIVLFNTFLEHFHAQRFAERMPLCLRNVGGSIWLRRR
jgi:hypothetical protein